MRNAKFIGIFFVFLGICAPIVNAQELENTTIKDSLKAKKNLRFSILGGPGYTPDYGFLIGGSALFTFSTNSTDTLLKRSVLPVAFAYMTNGGGSVIIRPQLFFFSDRFRIFGQLSFNNTIDNYYGVGYTKNTETQRASDSTQYRHIGYKFNPIFLFRWRKSELFYGGSIDITHRDWVDPSPGVQEDDNYRRDGGDSSGLTYLNAGIGLNIAYDTRDIPANAYSGIFIEMAAVFYDQNWGSTQNFQSFNMQYKQFQKLAFLGKRKVLAWMVNGEFTRGDVPLTDLAMLGSPYDLRGYYMGQYRDKNAIMGVLEYRHMFNTNQANFIQRMVSKLGFAAWTGLGSMGPELSQWSPILPNYGAGLRIELQPRMNFRIDVGVDPINDQTLLYFNMTEAF